MSSLSVKSCEVMQYWSYMDVNEIAVIQSRIEELTQIKSYCIITHDKDILPSGEIKPPHFHAVLTFKNATTINSIAKAIGVAPQYVNKIKSTTKTAQLYLVHRNNSEKYQYSPEDVKANFDYVTFADDCPAKQKREHIANLIDNGTIKRYNLHAYVSVDDYAKNANYYERCFRYRQCKLNKVDRSMQCIYIQGASGVGKTTFAKHIAKQNHACFISSGGKNPLDDYKGEEVIILDDTRSQNWSISDLIKLTDNNTDSLVGCRYYNKSIGECQILIITSVKSINDFFKDAQNSENEPIEQFLRRITTVFKMYEDKITVYGYDETEKKHKYVTTIENPVSAWFGKNNSIEKTKSLITQIGLQILADNIEDKFDLVELSEDIPF